MPIPDNLTEILAGAATNNAYTDDVIVVTGIRTGSGGTSYIPERGSGIPEYIPDEPNTPFGFGDGGDGHGGDPSPGDCRGAHQHGRH